MERKRKIELSNIFLMLLAFTLIVYEIVTLNFTKDIALTFMIWAFTSYNCSRVLNDKRKTSAWEYLYTAIEIAMLVYMLYILPSPAELLVLIPFFICMLFVTFKYSRPVIFLMMNRRIIMIALAAFQLVIGIAALTTNAFNNVPVLEYFRIIPSMILIACSTGILIFERD